MGEARARARAEMARKERGQGKGGAGERGEGGEEERVRRQQSERMAMMLQGRGEAEETSSLGSSRCEASSDRSPEVVGSEARQCEQGNVKGIRALEGIAADHNVAVTLSSSSDFPIPHRLKY